jgi:uncharacterized protein
MLPQFPYHPDPIATRVIQASDETCVCCGQTRGYVYRASIYTVEKIQGRICPWCIADGTAAQKYNATFSDRHPLARARLSETIIDEVTRRTPGYISWQQEVWLACCNDACAFHGDATAQDLQELTGDDLEQFLFTNEITRNEWARIVKNYRPAGSISLYKFICRHCQKTKYGIDYS